MSALAIRIGGQNNVQVRQKQSNIRQNSKKKPLKDRRSRCDFRILTTAATVAIRTNLRSNRNCLAGICVQMVICPRSSLDWTLSCFLHEELTTSVLDTFETYSTLNGFLLTKQLLATWSFLEGKETRLEREACENESESEQCMTQVLLRSGFVLSDTTKLVHLS